MHLVDHQELEPPAMLCPFRTKGDGNQASCMGAECALWYRSKDHERSGCSVFIAAFYSRNVSYYTRYPSRRRE